ncbi:MAG: hypothetical protein WD600_05465, partial [Pseudohongiella sp.]
MIEIPGVSGSLPDEAVPHTDSQDKGAADVKGKKLNERQKARRMLLQALYQWEIARAPVNVRSA